MPPRFPTTAALAIVVALMTRGAAPAFGDGGATTKPAGAPRVFRAGAAAIDVSPTTFPVFAAGYFNPRPATRVVHPLYARCVVMDDGNTRVAMVVVDLVKIWRDVTDPVRAAASKATGIPPEHIMVAATHTHAAPGVSVSSVTPVAEEYKAALPALLVQAIVEANANLEPAQVGWSVVAAPEYTHNRRWIYRSDRMANDPFGQRSVRAHMHPGHESPNHVGPSGPVDPDLSMFAVRSPSGRPIAVFLNYSQHYFGASPISSDYQGLVAKRVEQAAMKAAAPEAEPGGRPCVAIFSQGTSGDLMWHDYARPKGRWTLESYSDAVARRAMEGYAKVAYRDWAPLGVRQASITAGIRKPDERRTAWARAKLAGLGDRAPAALPEIYAVHATRLADGPAEAEVVLQAFRVGDLAITATPAEVFAISGLRLKAQSPFAATFNVSQANHGFGYIPPPHQHALGGYTTWPTFGGGLAADAEPKAVEALLGMLEDLSGEPRRPLREADCDYARAVLASEPAAYWRLGEMHGTAAEDYSGRGQAATVEPGVALFLEGPAGRGLAGGPRGNRAMHTAGGRVVADAKLPADAYSVELWFWNGFPDGVRDVAGYLLSRGPNGVPGEHVGLGGSGENAGRLLLGLGGREPLVGHGRVPWRTWNHLVLTREGNRVRAYLNGEPDADGEARAAEANAALYFGGRGDGKVGWEGKLDEIALYDRPLSPEEVRRHFAAAGVTQPDAPAGAP